MTRNTKLQKAVRARMEQTGEPYTAARAALRTQSVEAGAPYVPTCPDWLLPVPLVPMLFYGQPALVSEVQGTVCGLAWNDAEPAVSVDFAHAGGVLLFRGMDEGLSIQTSGWALTSLMTWGRPGPLAPSPIMLRASTREQCLKNIQGGAWALVARRWEDIPTPEQQYKAGLPGMVMDGVSRFPRWTDDLQCVEALQCTRVEEDGVYSTPEVPYLQLEPCGLSWNLRKPATLRRLFFRSDRHPTAPDRWLLQEQALSAGTGHSLLRARSETIPIFAHLAVELDRALERGETVMPLVTAVADDVFTMPT